MKVKLGPYIDYWGPYQLADLLQKAGVSKDRCHSIGQWLSDHTPLNRVCQWIHDRRSRTMSIRIDPWDTWSMDNTLSHIILPMLRQLHSTKHGAPFVDDQDVPDHLRSTAAEPKENEWDTDSNHFLRWDWVLGEMIFAFECKVDDSWQDQFHSGQHDILWVPATHEDQEVYQMITGPNDTYQCDHAGMKVVEDRIQNGLSLFGKYFSALWD